MLSVVVFSLALAAVGITVLYGVSVSGGGVSIQKTVSRTGDGMISYEVTLPAGKSVTSWVKTDANTAGCDLPSGHGYSNGNFDVHWTESSVPKVRYGVPGTISTNALSLDGGTGDDFPATATTGIVVTKQVALVLSIDGDNAEIVAVAAESTDPSSTSRAHLDLQDSGAATIEEIDLVANVPQVWDIDGGATNVFTGNPITQGYASCGSASESLTLKIVGVQDVST